MLQQLATLTRTEQRCVAMLAQYGAEASVPFLAQEAGVVEGTFRNALSKANTALGLGKDSQHGQGGARERLTALVRAVGWKGPVPDGQEPSPSAEDATPTTVAPAGTGGLDAAVVITRLGRLTRTEQACVQALAVHGPEMPIGFLAQQAGVAEGTFRNALSKAYTALGIGKDSVQGQGGAKARLASLVRASNWKGPSS